MIKSYMVLVLLLTGCATNSGVMKVGPDTYRTSSHYSPVRGGARAAKDDVIRIANEYCEGKGKEVVMEDGAGGMNSLGTAATNYEATFQCR